MIKFSFLSLTTTLLCLLCFSCALEGRKRLDQTSPRSEKSEAEGGVAPVSPSTPLAPAAIKSAESSAVVSAAPAASPVGDQAAPQALANSPSASDAKSGDDVYHTCVRELGQLKLRQKIKMIDLLCKDAKELPACTSVDGRKIFYFERLGVTKPNEKSSQKILSFSLIHGDEEESAAVTLAWLERLKTIEPRNSWRVIPILNPDGWMRKTRTNAHGIDVNRNFPSKDWHETALQYWKTETNQNARRFPGYEPASEPETKCAMAQIDDFKPDFIISIHTPLGVLDFDGPKVSAPAFAPLPWVSLGNFPGSLGRYMWIDRGVPVLTVELKRDGLKHLEEFDRLQDASGTVAIQAEKLLKKKKSGE